MTKLEYRQYLIKKQKDISEEGKNVKNVMAAITYRCIINILEGVIDKFDTIED